MIFHVNRFNSKDNKVVGYTGGILVYGDDGQVHRSEGNNTYLTPRASRWRRLLRWLGGGG